MMGKIKGQIVSSYDQNSNFFPIKTNVKHRDKKHIINNINM